MKASSSRNFLLKSLTRVHLVSQFDLSLVRDSYVCELWVKKKEREKKKEEEKKTEFLPQTQTQVSEHTLPQVSRRETFSQPSLQHSNFTHDNMKLHAKQHRTPRKNSENKPKHTIQKQKQHPKNKQKNPTSTPKIFFRTHTNPRPAHTPHS